MNKWITWAEAELLNLQVQMQERMQQNKDVGQLNRNAAILITAPAYTKQNYKEKQ